MRAVVFDLDGTLLGPDHRVRPAVRAAMERYHAKGGRVLLATSRPPASAARIALDLGLTGAPAVALNGAVLVDFGAGSGQPRLEGARALPDQAGPIMVEEAVDLEPFFYADWRWAVLRLGPDALREAAAAEVHPVVTDDISGLGPLLKISARGAPARIEALLERLRCRLPESALVRPEPENLELMASGVTKASALEGVLRTLAIPWSDVVAVGDMDNDLEMIARAGIGVAMGNGSPAARAAADRVVGTNDTDTLGELLDALDPAQAWKGPHGAWVDG